MTLLWIRAHCVQRIEEGDPSVGIGIYAAVLQELGLREGLGQIADVTHDIVSQALAAADLPERARLRDHCRRASYRENRRSCWSKGHLT